MTVPRRSLSIFGSTGSVGAQTIRVVEEQGGAESFDVVALTCDRNVELLAEQAKSLNAKIAVAARDECLEELRARLDGFPTEAAAGGDALAEAAARPADWTMSAIVGFAGLLPGLRCLERGGTLALANKESLVAAGRLLTSTARKTGAMIVPVDSEHSALFQLLSQERRDAVETLTLTASGGPFRKCTMEQLSRVTPEEAVKHPTWNMGTRISIDSATMFNKALELIEARELFGIDPESILVVVHPQSIVHALVGFHDGQVLAHMSSTDMRGAIEYSLNWPARLPSKLKRLDLAELSRLEFEAPDEERFPATRLAREVLALGGLAGSAFNGAKEAALDAFLEGVAGFLDISRAVESVMNRMESTNGFAGDPFDLAQIVDVDRVARVRVNEYFSAKPERG